VVEDTTSESTVLPVSKERWQGANDLLTFAVEKGIEIEKTDIDLLRTLPEDADSTAFDQAYTRLAKKMSPVTAETLRATSLHGGRSDASSWSQRLWMFTLFFLLLIVLAGLSISFRTVFAPIDTTTDSQVFSADNNWAAFSEFVLPFLFGALGACAYLLRICHWYIHRRTFDPRRKPEYINRILLGLVSGGAGGLLFGRYILSAGDGDGVADLSTAAIGFLCGYNNDFLFTTVERLAAALFPKQSPAKPEATESTDEKKTGGQKTDDTGTKV
jgi:hypothetical protein